MSKVVLNREPRTKEELMTRLLAQDYNGNLSNLSPAGARLKRLSPYRLDIELPESGVHFHLLIIKPKTEDLLAKTRAAYAQKEGYQKLSEEKRKQLGFVDGKKGTKKRVPVVIGEVGAMVHRDARRKPADDLTPKKLTPAKPSRSTKPRA